MDEKQTAQLAIRDFLVTRRARVTPEAAGLPVYGSKRRVKGLRREEVAMPAGISSEYYVRFERGRVPGASPSVVDAVATALRLNDDERDHLSRLLATRSGSWDRIRRGGHCAAQWATMTRGQFHTFSSRPQSVVPAAAGRGADIVPAVFECPSAHFDP
jgi:hypothetical protein